MKKSKNATVFLNHILKSIEKIEEYTKDISRVHFLKDFQVQDAVIRRLEIIGEAAKNLPEELIKGNPDIPWKKIIGTRDILIHHYFGIDMEVIWKILKKRIPELKEIIQELLKSV